MLANFDLVWRTWRYYVQMVAYLVERGDVALLIGTNVLNPMKTLRLVGSAPLPVYSSSELLLAGPLMVVVASFWSSQYHYRSGIICNGVSSGGVSRRDWFDGNIIGGLCGYFNIAFPLFYSLAFSTSGSF